MLSFWSNQNSVFDTANAGKENLAFICVIGAVAYEMTCFFFQATRGKWINCILKWMFEFVVTKLAKVLFLGIETCFILISLWHFITKRSSCFIRKCKFMAKCGRFIFTNATAILRNATTVAKCNDFITKWHFYCKIYLLQNALVHYLVLYY